MTSDKKHHDQELAVRFFRDVTTLDDWARYKNFCEMMGPVALADLIEVNGKTSDGYHTFDELYDHRAKLFSVIVSTYPELSWKSKQHSDGSMYDGMFIVGIETPEGSATYHYDVDPYWDLFECEEFEKAPEWDGHTSDDAISRILSLKRAVPGKALKD